MKHSDVAAPDCRSLRGRVSIAAVLLATLAWAAGCGTPHPMIEPFLAARTYTPERIAVLPPAVFMIYDQFGDNDQQRSWQLGQAVAQQTVGLIADELQRRGYQVSLQARWDGIYDQNGQILVGGNDLAWLGNSIIQFANSDAGGGEGPITAPAFITPELAQRVGWATQSDALLYVNMKGVSVSSGKRTAQVLGVVFFVVIIAAIIALALSEGHGGHGSSGGHSGGVGTSSTTAMHGVSRAGFAHPVAGGAAAGAIAHPVAGGAAAGAIAHPVVGGAVPHPVLGGAAHPGGSVVAVPPGRGSYFAGGGGGRVYAAPPPRAHYGGGVGVNVGVGVMVPVDGPTYTHEGQVADDDDVFSGDEIHVTMTLISAQDGRVLWHVRDSVDVDPDRPAQVETFVRRYLDTIPPSLALGANPVIVPAPPPASTPPASAPQPPAVNTVAPTAAAP